MDEKKHTLMRGNITRQGDSMSAKHSKTFCYTKVESQESAFGKVKKYNYKFQVIHSSISFNCSVIQNQEKLHNCIVQKVITD